MEAVADVTFLLVAYFDITYLITEHRSSLQRDRRLQVSTSKVSPKILKSICQFELHEKQATPFVNTGELNFKF